MVEGFEMVPVFALYIGSVLLSRASIAIVDGIYNHRIKRDGYRPVPVDDLSMSETLLLELFGLVICLLPILNFAIVGYGAFSILSNYEKEVIKDLQEGMIEKIPEDEIIKVPKKEKNLLKRKKTLNVKII